MPATESELYQPGALLRLTRINTDFEVKGFQNQVVVLHHYAAQVILIARIV